MNNTMADLMTELLANESREYPFNARKRPFLDLKRRNKSDKQLKGGLI